MTKKAIIDRLRDRYNEIYSGWKKARKSADAPDDWAFVNHARGELEGLNERPRFQDRAGRVRLLYLR